MLLMIIQCYSGRTSKCYWSLGVSGNASRRKDISNRVFNERKDILQVGITCMGRGKFRAYRKWCVIHFDELRFLIKTGWTSYLQVILQENKINYLFMQPLLFRSLKGGRESYSSKRNSTLVDCLIISPIFSFWSFL